MRKVLSSDFLVAFWLVVACAWLVEPLHLQQVAQVTAVLGRPTARSMTISVVAEGAVDAYVDYGLTPGQTTGRTATVTLRAGTSHEFTLAALRPGTRYFYRLRYREAGAQTFTSEPEQMFSTARPPGAAFSFGVQADSHPERAGDTFSPDLYARTLDRARRELLDFYLLLGDDFSVQSLAASSSASQSGVDAVYARQRGFLAALGASTPLFLVNGDHERAARARLDGTPTSLPVLAALARGRHFALPVPDDFYSGNAEPVPGVGLPRDYYAWTWGDALLVVIDPYWHSPVLVDDAVGDPWAITIGDAQYAWLSRTLESSTARYKFVFSHHVLGAGRGGIENAHLFEWGGQGRQGGAQFAQRRPRWPLPIHQLMVKTGVSVFFQGHDHLFARQEKDGVVYQTVPSPADPTYSAVNRDAYRSGVVLPNSGHLRVSVGPDSSRVDYVRAVRERDETPEQRDGDVAFTYTVSPRP